MRNLSFRFIAVIFFSFLSFSAFCVPGENKMHGNGDFQGGGNEKKAPPSRKKSSSGSGSDRRSSTSVSALINEPEKDGEKTITNSFNPETGWHTITESSDIVNFRGTRKASVYESLKVACVQVEKNWNGNTIIEICFNQEINARKFSSSNLKINGKTANNDVKFKFSRNGDSVKIQVPSNLKDFSLSLNDVESFGGEKISEIQLGKISVN